MRVMHITISVRGLRSLAGHRRTMTSEVTINKYQPSVDWPSIGLTHRTFVKISPSTGYLAAMGTCPGPL